MPAPKFLNTLLERLVGEALDADRFYNDDVKAFVLARLGDADPAKESFLGETVLAGRPFAERKSLQDLVESRIAAKPRGAWACFNVGYDGKDLFSIAMSDGSGGIAAGGRFETLAHRPKYNEAYAAMIGHEIYQARQSVDSQRALAKDLEAIDGAGFHEGMKVGKVDVSRQSFSSGEIIKVDREKGVIELALVKRGSARRYVGHISGSRLAASLGIQIQPQEAPAP